MRCLNTPGESFSSIFFFAMTEDEAGSPLGKPWNVTLSPTLASAGGSRSLIVDLSALQAQRTMPCIIVHPRILV